MLRGVCDIFPQFPAKGSRLSVSAQIGSGVVRDDSEKGSAGFRKGSAGFRSFCKRGGSEVTGGFHRALRGLWHGLRVEKERFIT